MTRVFDRGGETRQEPLIAGIRHVADRKDAKGAPHREGAQMEFSGFECADTIMGSVLWAGMTGKRKVKPPEPLAE